MSPSPTTQPGRAATRPDGEISRTRILDAAERLLAERGYAGTSIAAISRESGLPASSIYWFFESKQQLTGSVIARAEQRFLDAIEVACRAGAPEGRLARLMERAFDESGPRLPEFLRLELLLGLAQDPGGPAIDDDAQTQRERSRSLVEDAVAGAISSLGPKCAAAVATELTPLAMSFLRGALISSHMEPGSIDLLRLREELGVALLAIAKHRIVGASG